MKFLVDHQLPAALARWLAARADAIHVLDCGMDATPDGDIWKDAMQEGRIVVSKDEDCSISPIAPESQRVPSFQLGMGLHSSYVCIVRFTFHLGADTSSALVEMT